MKNRVATSMAAATLVYAAVACADGGSGEPLGPSEPPGGNPPANVGTLRLELVSGGGQSMVSGCPLAKPVRVRVLDERNQPRTDQRLTFVSLHGGTVTAGAQTAADASISVEWRLPASGAVADTLVVGLEGQTLKVGAGIVPTAPVGFGVVGNRIYRADCERFRFAGVNRPGFQWHPAQRQTEDNFVRIREWGANTVRIPLSQGFWLTGSASHDPAYRQSVEQSVRWARGQGLNVVLDLHYSDGGDLSMPMAMGQRMPDRNSVRFWRELALQYGNDGGVMFDLYNEPRDVSWSVWRNGGPSGDGYDAVGMQELYDVVRSTGARNLIIVNGLNWGYDLSGLPAHALDGYNIVYGTHLYPFEGKRPGDWQRSFTFLADRYPLFIGEFGTFDCSTGYLNDVLALADEHDISWTAWAWFTEDVPREQLCRFPALIADWNGTPLETGAVVRAALQSYGPTGFR